MMMGDRNESPTDDLAFSTTVTASGTTCPACKSIDGRVFYQALQVPVHQVRLIRSRQEALDCDKGDIKLWFCASCGFIWNSAFNPSLIQYHNEYESTQAVSPTFNHFHDLLARDLVTRYQLKGKNVLEIGCGQGEFLELLQMHGARSLIGFDPVNKGTPSDGITIVRQRYSHEHHHLRPHFVATKMVMEHIPDPYRFLTMIRRTIGDRPGVIIFAMMPEVTRILDLRAFWDVFYEHCSYFSLGSLARAFRTARFDVLDLWMEYDGQYACIGTRPGKGDGLPLPNEEAVEDLARRIDAFSVDVAGQRALWSDWLAQRRAEGNRIVLWGGGSKGVSFLSTLDVTDQIDFVIDINTNRTNTYIAGTGQRIMQPGFLGEYKADIVIVMSPIYMAEITAQLAAIGQSPRLFSIETPPMSGERN